ncbi:hypothetical protein POUND7_000609 [Theobroma cacao]
MVQFLLVSHQSVDGTLSTGFLTKTGSLKGALCWVPDDGHLILVCMCLKVLALVVDQLDYGDNICGAVLSIRFNEDILSVWNRNVSDHQAVMALRDSIKRHLKLPHSYVMEYKPHDASLRDNSSYRKAWLRG